jgi:hypothetical protein
MSEVVYDDIYDRLNELVEKEKRLRAEMAAVRDERARLKSQLNFHDLSKPAWVSELPEKFWYPSFYTSKVINDLHPNLDYNNVPPDLVDWAKRSGVREFIINTALGIGIAIVALQLFFFLL